MDHAKNFKVRMINGIRLTYPDFVIKAYDEAKGQYEPDAFKIWERLALGGNTMVDVGMYTGIYAIKAAILGSKVYGFEPNPYVFKQAEFNFHLNSIPTINAFNMGLYNTVGVKDFYMDFSKPITSAGSFQPKFNLQQIKNLEVPVQMLDNFMLKDVACIKIDAERSEYKVLQGALRTIERYRPNIIIELLDDDSLIQSSSLLQDYGYVRETLRHCLYHFYF